jgi:hypothetical protein
MVLFFAGRRREEEHITHPPSSPPNKNVAVVQLACCWITVMCSSLVEKDKRSRYLAVRALQELHGATTLVVTKQQLT